MNLKKVKKLPIIAAFFVFGIIVALFFLSKSGLFKRDLVTTFTNPESVKEELTPEKLKVVQLKVTLESDGVTSELPLNSETEVKAGDKITTDIEGVAVLTYPSGTIVRIGPDSVVTFVDSESLSQEAGKVYVRFKKLLGVQEEFEVESSDAIATVRGTAFASIIKNNTDPKILVTDHEVEFTPKATNGEKLTNLKKLVKKGEQGSVSRTSRQVGVILQRLSEEEKDWLDFNRLSDEDPTKEDLLSAFRSLRRRTFSPTPAPSGTPRASSTPTPAPASFNSMPGAGYNRGSVATSVGTFTLSCYGGSKSSLRMITDSASDGDCSDNCPTLPLADYATRNGGVAAINGMYFCPPDYPACAGKVNSFDTLFFNSRTKFYMNSANNVYSTIPFVGMNSDHSMNFVGQSSSWGRDTGIIGGTAGNPLLTAGGAYVVNDGALEDRQRSVKANRGAIVQDADMIYLCITSGATVPDSGRVFEKLGADNAINIDGGGSSALWVGGSYKFGPGRSLPAAIILAP